MTDRIQPAFSVSRDEYGTPHLRADSMDALMWGLGYTFAEDRLWQLEFLRRRALGTMAEVAGSGFAASDYVARGMRFAELGRKLWENQESRGFARHLLPAFVAGINAYVAELRERRTSLLPPEFRVLGIRPSPVEPEELTALIFLYAGMLTRDAIQSRLAQILANLRDPAQAHEVNDPLGAQTILRVATLDEDRPPELVPGVSLGEWLQNPDACFVRLQLHFSGTESDSHTSLSPKSYRMGIGSNAWAVTRARSSEDAPLFAADPHLEVTDPPFFYEVTLECPEFRFAGALLAGLPFAGVGFNGAVAWGSTNLGVDYSEFIQEPFHAVRRASSWRDRVRVRVFPGWRMPLVFKPLLHSERGWMIQKIPRFPSASSFWNYIFLEKGAVKPRLPGTLSLFWWGSLVTDFSLDLVYRMLTARNITEFRESLRDFAIPPQNFVFADVNGAIGYQAAGRIPVRSPETTRTLWSAREFDHLPKRFIAFDELPHWNSRHSPRGFVATANNPPAGPEYPYVMPGIFGEEYRAARIVSVLGGKNRFSVDDMMALQGDHLVLRAKLLLPLLRKCVTKSVHRDSAERYFKELDRWDGVADTEAFAPLIFRMWMDEIEEARSREKLPNSDSAMAAELVCAERGIKQMVADAFARTVARVENLEKTAGKPLRWGDFHRILRTHPLGPVSRFFRHNSDAHGGDRGTVDPGPSARRDARGIPFWIQTHGAAYRFVAVVSDPPRLYTAMPGASPCRSRSPEADRLRWEQYLQHRYRMLPFP
ncbi:MAG: penicillin acylase family protein [bacterium JZ-2024 1]